MRILITGGAGYIGSHIVKMLGEKGYSVLTLDNLSTGRRENVLYGAFKQADLADREVLETIFGEFKPDIVMHLAASIVVSESVSDPIKYYNNNVANTLNLLDVMFKYGVKSLIYSSTAAVYGTPEAIPLTEGMQLRPTNPYGSSKAMVESMLSEIAQLDPEFRYVALRYFNVAGADSDLKIGQTNDKSTHLITRAIKAAKGEIDRLFIYGTDYPTHDGTCIRDYIHVDDIATAHYLAMLYLAKGGRSDVFNCGYGRGYSVKEVIGVVKAVTGVDFKVEASNRRPGDVPIMVADSSKIKAVLGWKPCFDDLRFIVDTAWRWELHRQKA